MNFVEPAFSQFCEIKIPAKFQTYTVLYKSSVCCTGLAGSPVVPHFAGPGIQQSRIFKLGHIGHIRFLHYKKGRAANRLTVWFIYRLVYRFVWFSFPSTSVSMVLRGREISNGGHAGAGCVVANGLQLASSEGTGHVTVVRTDADCPTLVMAGGRAQ